MLHAQEAKRLAQETWIAIGKTGQYVNTSTTNFLMDRMTPNRNYCLSAGQENWLLRLHERFVGQEERESQKEAILSTIEDMMERIIVLESQRDQ